MTSFALAPCRVHVHGGYPRVTSALEPHLHGSPSWSLAAGACCNQYRGLRDLGFGERIEHPDRCSIGGVALRHSPDGTTTARSRSDRSRRRHARHPTHQLL